MKICQVTSMHPWNDDRIYQRTCGALVREGNRNRAHRHQGRGSTRLRTSTCPHSSFKKRRGWRLADRSTPWTRHLAAACKSTADIVHFHDPDLIPWMVLLALRGTAMLSTIFTRITSLTVRRLGISWASRGYRQDFVPCGREGLPSANLLESCGLPTRDRELLQRSGSTLGRAGTTSSTSERLSGTLCPQTKSTRPLIVSYWNARGWLKRYPDGRAPPVHRQSTYPMC